MKKRIILSLTALISLVSVINAQKISQKAQKTFGIMFNGGGTISQDVSMFYGMASTYNLYTRKTHHHAMLALLSTSTGEEANRFGLYFETLNGLEIGDDWDIYVYSQTPLKKGDNYLSFGIEKVLQSLNRKGEPSKTVMIPFMEFGTTNFKNLSFSSGILLHTQFLLRKKKN